MPTSDCLPQWYRMRHTKFKITSVTYNVYFNRKQWYNKRRTGAGSQTMLGLSGPLFEPLMSQHFVGELAGLSFFFLCTSFFLYRWLFFLALLFSSLIPIHLSSPAALVAPGNTTRVGLSELFLTLKGLLFAEPESRSPIIFSVNNSSGNAHIHPQHQYFQWQVLSAHVLFQIGKIAHWGNWILRLENGKSLYPSHLSAIENRSLLVTNCLSFILPAIFWYTALCNTWSCQCRK